VLAELAVFGTSAGLRGFPLLNSCNPSLGFSPGIQICILFQTPKNLRTTPSLKSDATFL